VQGAWKLTVKDVAGQDTGKLNRWSLEILTEAGPTPVRADAAPALAIPDNSPTGITSRLAIAQAGNVGAIKVSVDITHTYIGDLRIELSSPTGRSVVLHGQLGGNQDNIVITYDSTAPLSPLTQLVGQAMQGDWVLRVADLAAVDVGTLNRWSLEITPAA